MTKINGRQDPARCTYGNVISGKSRISMTMTSNSYSWFRRKMPVVLNKNENIQATTDQWATCQMKSSEPLGKGWKNMDQINKTDINDIISYIHEKKSTQLLSQLHLSRLWEFCHARSALVTSHTYRNSYEDGLISLKMNWWIFPRY